MPRFRKDLPLLGKRPRRREQEAGCLFWLVFFCRSLSGSPMWPTVNATRESPYRTFFDGQFWEDPQKVDSGKLGVADVQAPTAGFYIQF